MKRKDRSSDLSRFSNFSANPRAAKNAMPALDAGLLAAAQAVEHYEISRYGTLKSWANKLGMKDAAKLLDQTLTEEKKTDEALTEIADTAVNAEAG